MEKKVLKLYDDGKYHFFELYPNTEPIEIGICTSLLLVENGAILFVVVSKKEVKLTIILIVNQIKAQLIWLLIFGQIVTK